MAVDTVATTALAALALTPLVVLGGASTAHAAGDGLSYTSTTTYTVDAVSGVVHVLAEIQLRNTIPDKRDGLYISRRYFTGFSLPVPVGSINAAATTAKGSALRLQPRLIAGDSAFFLFDVDLASNLFYGQTARVNVAYDITGLPPRSDNPSRVNAAYAAFDAFGIGDDGQVTVRVVVPDGFQIDVFGDDAAVTHENGNTVYTATNIPNPNEFDIFVSARNDAGLTSSPVDTKDGDHFDLRSWPGDTEWQQFVTSQIDDGVPELATLIGQPWPIADKVEVREAYTPYLYGYAGWFSAVDKEIEIGEDLDQEVVLHELSHAWFNDSWFTDRWLSEGFAQVYSNKAIAALGGTASKPEIVVPTDPGKVTLNSWGDPNFVDGADKVEAYGYNTSFSVVERIVDGIDDDAMRTIFAAVDANTIPYLGNADPESSGGSADWRRFLDLAEEIGGSTNATDLFRQYVVTDDQAAMLDERSAARDKYHQLVDDGGEWAPPVVVRRRMTTWSFTDAAQLINDSEDVLALRDELTTKAGTLGTSYPDTYQADYEGSTANLDDVSAEIQKEIDTADAVLAAVDADAADDGLFGSVGLVGTDLPALLDEAKTAFSKGDHDTARADAQKVIDTIDKAPDVGKERSLLALGGLVLLIGLIVLAIVLVKRRRRRKTAELDALGAEQAPESTESAASTESPSDEATIVEPADATPVEWVDELSDGARTDDPTF